MSLCSICYDKGFVYMQYKEEYHIEVCQCQAPKEIQNEVN